MPQVERLTQGLLTDVDESGAIHNVIPVIVNLYKDALEGVVKKPGLSLLNNLSTSTSVNGLYYWIDQNTIIATSNKRVFKIDPSTATATDVTGDQLDGNSPTTFALVGDYIVMAAGGRMIKLGKTGTTAYIADTDAPVNVTHVATMDTYLIANKVGSNQFYFSAPGDIESWNALDFATAQVSPDIIMGLAVYENNLYLLGSETIEVWYDDGVTPFSRIDSLTIGNGCSAAASIVVAAGSLWWLNTDRKLVRMTSRQFAPVSEFVQRSLTRVTTVGDCKSTYITFDGRSFIMLTFSTDNITLCYDIDSGKWCQWGEWDSINQVYKSDRIFSSVNLSLSQPMSTLANPTKYTGTVINDAAVGTLAWTNPTNAQGVADSVVASRLFTAAGQITNYLNCQNFSAALPLGVYIVGIEVIGDIKVSFGSGGGLAYGEHIYADGYNTDVFKGTVIDSSIRLIKGGVISGDNKAKSQSIGIGGKFSWGASNDLWGLTFAPSDVNLTTFGAALSFTCSAYSYTGAAGEVQPHVWIDDVAIIVYYKSAQINTDVVFAVVVGDKSNGKVYLLSSDNINDDGVDIRSVVRTGHRNFSTLRRKRSSRMSIRYKPDIANLYETAPLLKIRWRNESSNSWSSFKDVPIGTKGNSFISGLGMYRTRQYEFVFEEPTQFQLYEIEEEVELMMR